MDLVRGQRAKLSDLTAETRLKIGIRLEGPNAAEVVCVALLLGESQEAISPSAIVFTDQPRSDCGGVTVQGRTNLEQVFDVDVTQLASLASHVLFAVALLGPASGALGCARNIRQGTWWLEAGGKEVARYAFAGADFGDDAAIAMGEIYRKNTEWRVRVIGDGFVGGLAAMLSRYKIAPSQVSRPAAGPGASAGLSSAPTGFWLPKTWAGDQTPTVPKNLLGGVGLVVAKTEQGTTHTGTGFAVSPGGYFITCHHVVENVAHLAICLEGTRVLRNAEVVAQNPESDLALCWISDRNGTPDWLLLAGPEETRSLGDELGLLGFPLGVDLGLSVTYSRGIINSLRNRGEVAVLQIDVGAAPGSSGGPVFRRSDGKVLGVLTSGLDVSDRGMLIKFAVDVQMLWRLGWLS